MDAAFKKTALVLSLALALLAAMPRPAQAAPAVTFTYPTTGTLISLVNGSASLTVTGSADATTPISFNVVVQYQSGDQPWLEVGNDTTAVPGGACNGGTSTYTTPSTMGLGVKCYAPSQGNHIANVTLNATSPVSVPSVTFQVNYNTGGGSSAVLVPSPANFTGSNALSAAVGTQVSANVMLQTSSTSPVAFTAGTGASWLTLSPSSGQASSTAPATIGLTASASGLAAGTYYSTVTVYWGASQSLIINVTFNVSSSAVTLSPSALAWTYSNGSLSPSSFQSVVLATPNADSYTATISYPSQATAVNWLQVNNSNIATGLLNGTTLSVAVVNYTGLATGTYTGSITVTDTSNSSSSAVLPVTLTVSGSTSGSLTISPSPISLNATNNYEQVVTVTSSAGGALTVTPTPTNSWLGVTPSANSIVAGASAYLTVTGNTSVSGSGTFTGSIQITVGSVSQTVTVNLTSGSGSGGGTSGYVAPTTLNFVGVSGGATVAQQVVFAGDGNFSVATSPTYSANSGSVAWLISSQVAGTMSEQGTEITIYANPKNLAPATYTATIALGLVIDGVAENPSPTLQVNFVVTSGEVMASTPSTVLFNTGATSQNTTLQVSASGASALPLSVSTDQTWLNATVTGGATTTPAGISVVANANGLDNGLHAGTVTITSASAPPLYVPVVLVVAGAVNPTGLTLSSPSLTFAAIAGGSAPTTQTLTVTSSSPGTPFTAVATVVSPYGGNWLSINPQGNLETNQPITVSVSQAGLPTGTYAGNIAFTANGSTINVPVNLVVNTTGSAGGVNVSTSSLTFSALSGGAAPASQTVSITSAAGSASLSFTATATSTGNWLSIVPLQGSTPATMTVSVNQANLSAGAQNGTITITPASGSSVNVNVTLNVVSQPVITVSPESLSFNFQAGSGGSVSPGQLTLSATGGTASFQASASSSGNWLSVTPTSGSTSTSTTLTVQVNPAGLSASSTLYSGTITINGLNGTVGSTTVNVTLSVTAPLPLITAVLNAGSYANGPVSPGEIVSIFGTSIGPVNPSTLTLNSSGKVSTSLGGVTVDFSGYPAPLTYVSSGQINCIVPYELAGNKGPFVEVTFAGQKSNEPSLQLATSAPGVFTQNGLGSGPGAILNQDYTLNTQADPAAVGSIIQLFMTGEGLTTPSQADGTLTPVNQSGVGPLTPTPQLLVSALVGGLPAFVQYYGEAPGLVAGVLQVNVQIPATAVAGANTITIQIGQLLSQTGVTVWVK